MSQPRRSIGRHDVEPTYMRGTFISSADVRRLRVFAVLLATSLVACATGHAHDPPHAVKTPRIRAEATSSGETAFVVPFPTTVPLHLTGDGENVLVLGDSLVDGAREFGDLGRRLDAAGFDKLD